MRVRIRSPFRRSTVCSPPVCVGWPCSSCFVLQKLNVPCVPRRSGTHIPESSSPRNGAGGNVIGTRWMTLQMCLSPRSFQNACDFRSSFMRGFSSGTR